MSGLRGPELSSVKTSSQDQCDTIEQISMKRRDLLKLGASIATVPAAGLAQQHEHSATAANQIAKSGVSASDWKPELFDDHENQTLIALVDLMIPATDTPGAKAA